MRALNWLAFAAMIGFSACCSSGASADSDHERARQAVADGRILPLSAIAERAIATFGGTVLDVEYEDDDDDRGEDRRRGKTQRYEVKLLTADGRILKLDYDAATGALIRQRGRDRKRGDEDK
ncbi:MAG: PepSY domain-containing protein [Defluviicoccus sp.]